MNEVRLLKRIKKYQPIYWKQKRREICLCCLLKGKNIKNVLRIINNMNCHNRRLMILDVLENAKFDFIKNYAS